jgi:hypothetical protein
LQAHFLIEYPQQAALALLGALRPLPVAAVGRLQEQLMVEWIFHSNAIEGSTLTLREMQLILGRRWCTIDWRRSIPSSMASAKTITVVRSAMA